MESLAITSLDRNTTNASGQPGQTSVAATVDVELLTRLKLSAINQALPPNWEARSNNGRIHYINHEEKSVSWLPPEEAWLSSYGVPYGYERALDRRNKEYFINHVDQSTSFEDARLLMKSEQAAMPRTVRLVKDAGLSYGFVAGNEAPVVIKSVMSHGPSDGLLLVDDEILEVNGKDVRAMPRDQVVQLIKTSPHMVTLKVQQPSGSSLHKKSALLSASKKAKLRKSSLPRVRFADVDSPLSTTTGTPSHPDVLELLPNLPNKNGVPSVLMAALASMTSNACAATSNWMLQKNVNGCVPPMAAVATGGSSPNLGPGSGSGSGPGQGPAGAGPTPPSGAAGNTANSNGGASTGEKVLPPVMPDVIRVFLENGQTKAIRYDRKTTVRDVLKSLLVKLHIRSTDHFSLVLFHSSSATNSDLIVLRPDQRICDIAQWPGVQRCQCVLRVVLYVRDPSDLLLDEEAFEYFYLQCCNDVLLGFFASDVKDDQSMCQLAALQIWQYALRMHIDIDTKGIGTLNAIEKHCSLTYFLPRAYHTRFDKALRKLLAFHVRVKYVSDLVQSVLGVVLPATSNAVPYTERQVQLTYLKLLSMLPSYGSRTFVATCIDSSACDVWLVVSPRCGIAVRNSSVDVPVKMIDFEQIDYLLLRAESERMRNVEVHFARVSPNSITYGLPLTFSMTTQEARDFCNVVAGYHRLFVHRPQSQSQSQPHPPDTESFVRQEDGLDADESNTDAPPYSDRHRVVTSPWSYVDSTQPTHIIDFSELPAYSPRAAATRIVGLSLDGLNGNAGSGGNGLTRAGRRIAIHISNENGESSDISKLDVCDATAAGIDDAIRRQSIIDLRASPLDSRSSSPAPSAWSVRPRSLEPRSRSPQPLRLEQLDFTEDTDEVETSGVNALCIPPPPGFGDECSDLSVSSSSSSIPSSVSPEGIGGIVVNKLPSIPSDQELLVPRQSPRPSGSDPSSPLVSISCKMVVQPGNGALRPPTHTNDTGMVTSQSDTRITANGHGPTVPVVRAELSQSPRVGGLSPSPRRSASPSKNALNKIFKRFAKSASVETLDSGGNRNGDPNQNQPAAQLAQNPQVKLHQNGSVTLASKLTAADQEREQRALLAEAAMKAEAEQQKRKPRRSLSLDRIARTLRKSRPDDDASDHQSGERSRSSLFNSFKKIAQRKRVGIDALLAEHQNQNQNQTQNQNHNQNRDEVATVESTVSPMNGSSTVQIKMPLVTMRSKPIQTASVSASPSVNASPVKVPQVAPTLLPNGHANDNTSNNNDDSPLNAARVKQILSHIRSRSSYDIDSITIEAVDDLSTLQNVTSYLLEHANAVVTQSGKGLSSSTTSLNESPDSRGVVSSDAQLGFCSLQKLGKDIALECRLFISCSLRFELDSTVTFSVTLMQLFAKVLSTLNDLITSSESQLGRASLQNVSREMKLVHGLLLRFKKVLTVFTQCYKFCLLVVVENRRSGASTVNEWASKLAEALSSFVDDLTPLCKQQKPEADGPTDRAALMRSAINRLGSARQPSGRPSAAPFEIDMKVESSTC